MFDAREVLIPGSAYDRVNPSNGNITTRLAFCITNMLQNIIEAHLYC